jgi:hypothetical protein
LSIDLVQQLLFMRPSGEEMRGVNDPKVGTVNDPNVGTVNDPKVAGQGVVPTLYFRT